MKDFRQHFLLESTQKLQTLITDLAKKENLSDSDKSLIFRTLHTIKGTSQTFGFNISSRLAHELENLLSAEKKTETFNQNLIKGLKLLKNSLEQKDFKFPEDFINNLPKFTLSENNSQNFDRILSKLPPEIYENLSLQETELLNKELEKGKYLFCSEISFEISKFSGGIRSFSEILSKYGEIIATFPSSRFNSNDKIGFRILFASFERSEQIQKITEKYSAEIIFDSSPEIFDFDLQGIVAQTISHGKTVAENLGKTVEFEVSAGKLQISNKNLKLIFDILLHLIRNSIDHAFEKIGKIKIELESNKNRLFIRFSDDGCGIDLNKIRTKAVEKKLIQEENISDEATLELIFQSEFSTARKITEISGRGVGLDAVKNAVAEAGGEIKVKSNLNKGTIFEIFLPENEQHRKKF